MTQGQVSGVTQDSRTELYHARYRKREKGGQMVQYDHLEEKTNEELLEMYRLEGKLEVKQALTLRYLYIVKTIADRKSVV